MRERAEMLLKLACLALAALMFYQLSRFVTRTSPLQHLSIPELPSLAQGSETNVTRAATNPVAHSEPERKGINSAAGKEESKPATNTVSTNGAANPATNAVAGPVSGPGNTNAGTGRDSKIADTNSAAKKEAAKNQTNAVSGPASARIGMNPMPPAGPGKPPPDLPPLIQARIDRITQSEILGQIMRPLPMALLGIAGKTAFMRVPNGQTGLMKESEDLGGIKLLRIGTNRVLVEEDGQKKELMIFSGLGGETLMPQPKQNTNESPTKTQ
jgi:hypothetical protein